MLDFVGLTAQIGQHFGQIDQAIYLRADLPNLFALFDRERLRHFSEHNIRTI